MKSTTQTFNVSFPKALLAQVDAKAEEQFGSRSDFLRAAALQYLRNEEQWEYLFREGKKIGAEGKQWTEDEVAELVTAGRRENRRWIAKSDD